MWWPGHLSDDVLRPRTGCLATGERGYRVRPDGFLVRLTRLGLNQGNCYLSNTCFNQIVSSAVLAQPSEDAESCGSVENSIYGLLVACVVQILLCRRAVQDGNLTTDEVQP